MQTILIGLLASFIALAGLHFSWHFFRVAKQPGLGMGCVMATLAVFVVMLRSVLQGL